MFFENQNLNKAITFSYDDGTVQDIRLIELLNKYGLKCTFNLNSELLSTPNILIRNGNRINQYKIHKSDVKYVYEGHEIAVHTLTHPNLTKCDDQEIIKQVEKDRCNLSELAEYEIVGMAYPCGGTNNDERVADIIKNHTGIKYSRTITSTENFEPQTDLLRFNPTIWHLDFDKMMSLGEKFIELKTDTPKIFYIWGHSFEMDYDSNYWVKLENFFKLISNKNDIFYGTNKEVLL
ncbi:MAG: polysaccharide deacetylase family protein [Clostridia bacterium]|nr:polysaccharide deacetylase family protein [Clostridia bacterium]